MKEQRLAYWMVAPAAILLVVLVAYPFLASLYMSLTNRTIGNPGRFVGLRNFLDLLDDDIFRQTLWNSILYTVVAVAIKTVGGLMLALLLFRIPHGTRFLRSAVLLPWVVPISLSALTWWWMFDPQYSVANWVLRWSGVSPRGVPWLSDPFWARLGIILTNVWRGLPFFAICLLAGIVAIPRELYEAAETDGAGGAAQFWFVTIPLLRPILGIVVLYSTVMTISDFEIVYLLTRGGPRNSTHLFSTLAYQVGLVGSRIGQGAAISLFIFPVMVGAAAFLLRLLRSGEETG